MEEQGIENFHNTIASWEFDTLRDTMEDKDFQFSQILKIVNDSQNFNDGDSTGVQPEVDWKTQLFAVKGLLNLYIQENYTGPTIEYNNELLEGLKKFDKFVENSSKVLLDGEAMVENLKHPSLIMTAEYLLENENTNSFLNKCPSVHWWKIRTYFLHQKFLEEKSTTLWNSIQNHISIFESFCQSETLGMEYIARFYIELSEIYTFYYDLDNAKRCLQKAKNVIGISVNTKGVLGKRTKFQQRKIAQLVLNVEIQQDLDNLQNSFVENNSYSFPTVVILEDEDRLDKLELTENEPNINASTLTPVQHFVILAEQILRGKYLPHDDVYFEELLPYLTYLIESPKLWTVQMVCLLRRSVLEVSNRRTIERSMKQLEVLQKEITGAHPSFAERSKYFYGTGMPMKWEIEVSLAQVLSSLHLFKEALNISLRLNRWEDVISCYSSLNLRHKAEEVIREQLQNVPSVKLWILLGDATDNPEHYETAWKLSNERSAKAKRQWGYFHFVRKQYTECIPHLQKSLELNPLENPTWIRLGYASLITENWSISTKAYQHSSTLDSDNFEVWNNLANGFIKLGEKKKALRALKEAIKCNYDSWKLWDNTLVVATDCKEFDQVIRSYNRLLDLKGKWVDNEVLELLVRAMVTNMKDSTDQPSRDKYYMDSLKLFGRMTSLITNNPKIWKLYSDLVVVEYKMNSETERQIAWTKSLNFAQKSVECILSDNNWMKTEEKITEAVDFTVEYIKRLRDFQERNPDSKSDTVTNAEFTIKRVYNGIKKTRETAIVQEIFDKYLLEIKSNAEGLKILL